MKDHTHCNLIHSWADGAKIQGLLSGVWTNLDSPSWVTTNFYRIDPTCEYAAYYVRMNYAAEVDPQLYTDWVNGVTMETYQYGEAPCKLLPVKDHANPLETFCSLLDYGYTIRKHAAKVLWVVVSLDGEVTDYEYFPENYTPIGDDWYKVNYHVN